MATSLGDGKDNPIALFGVVVGDRVGWDDRVVLSAAGGCGKVLSLSQSLSINER